MHKSQCSNTRNMKNNGNIPSAKIINPILMASSEGQVKSHREKSKNYYECDFKNSKNIIPQLNIQRAECYKESNVKYEKGNQQRQQY